MNKLFYKELRHALVLMRIPFSFYLMPIYFFCISTIKHPDLLKAAVVFLILHFLLYPASSGYNSYCDKDDSPVGGLKNPPPVTRLLLWLVVLFDIATIICSAFVSLLFCFFSTVILLVSKAYSFRGIRLKKYPFTGTFAVTLFQGAFTFFTINAGMGMNPVEIFSLNNMLYALVSTLFLMGSYPMTQIYQHKTDISKSDKTLSVILGIRGTFVFTAVSFALASILLTGLYFLQNKISSLVIYILSILPLLFYFFSWWGKSNTDVGVVDYLHAMRLNFFSAVCLCSGFIAISIIESFQ